MQLSLTDLKEDYVFSVSDGKLASVEKKSLPNANIVITVANSLMESIMDKSSNPMTAYMTGKLKIKGPNGRSYATAEANDAAVVPALKSKRYFFVQDYNKKSSQRILA